MTAPLSLAGCAAAVGLSAERFRKVWKDWVRERAFPAPFSEPDEKLAWDADAVAAWKRDRAALRAQALSTPAEPPPAPANDLNPRTTPRAVQRDRAALQALMEGARR